MDSGATGASSSGQAFAAYEERMRQLSERSSIANRWNRGGASLRSYWRLHPGRHRLVEVPRTHTRDSRNDSSARNGSVLVHAPGISRSGPAGSRPARSLYFAGFRAADPRAGVSNRPHRPPFERATFRSPACEWPQSSGFLLYLSTFAAACEPSGSISPGIGVRRRGVRCDRLPKVGVVERSGDPLRGYCTRCAAGSKQSLDGSTSADMSGRDPVGRPCQV